MSLMEIYRVEVGVFLLGLLLVLGYKMATGKILLRGMFGETKVNPERVLLFVAMVVIGLVYIAQMIGRGAGELPGLSTGWLILYGTSCAIYLIVKAFRTFSAKRS